MAESVSPDQIEIKLSTEPLVQQNCGGHIMSGPVNLALSFRFRWFGRLSLMRYEGFYSWKLGRLSSTK